MANSNIVPKHLRPILKLPASDVEVSMVPPKLNMRSGVKPHESLQRLIKHRRCQCIVFSPAEQCFRVNLRPRGNGTRYTGLTKALQKHFWPDYNVKEAQKKADRNKQRERLNRQKRKAQKNVPWSKRRTEIQRNTRKHGIDLGRVVHEQVADYVNLSTEVFRKRYAETGVNAFVVKAAHALREGGLKPRVAEIPIFCEFSKVATSIDMVCTEVRSGTTVLVEMKTAYTGYFTKHIGHYLQSPLRKWESHPLNHARLQVLMSRLFLKHRYAISQVDAVVLRVTQDGLGTYPVPSQWFVVEDNLYKKLIRERRPSSRPVNIPSRVPIVTPRLSTGRKRARMRSFPSQRGTNKKNCVITPKRRRTQTVKKNDVLITYPPLLNMYNLKEIYGYKGGRRRSKPTGTVSAKPPPVYITL